MKTSASGNAILPNTFQHPNIFIDKLMYLLSAQENAVLTWAVRRILGFQENIVSRRDNISFSQFVDGIKSKKDGSYLSHGCGLSPTALRTALDSLDKYKILLPMGEFDPRKGQEYWLQDDEEAIDWPGLEKRLEEKKAAERKRTKKARSSVRQNNDECSVPQNSECSVPQNSECSVPQKDKTQGNPGKHTLDVHDKGNKKTVPLSGVTMRDPEPRDPDMQKVVHDANKFVDDILHQETKTAEAAKQGKAWKYRESFPENLRPLADRCAAKFGAPAKKKLVGWLVEIGDWYDRGGTVEDFDEAIKRTKGWNVKPISPYSLQNLMPAVIQERLTAGEAAPVRQWEYVDGRKVYL